MYMIGYLFRIWIGCRRESGNNLVTACHHPWLNRKNTMWWVVKSGDKIVIKLTTLARCWAAVDGRWNIVKPIVRVRLLFRDATATGSDVGYDLHYFARLLYLFYSNKKWCILTVMMLFLNCLALRTHDTLNRCWFNVGPASQTMGQH